MNMNKLNTSITKKMSIPMLKQAESAEKMIKMLFLDTKKVKSRQEEIPGDSLIIDANDFSYQKNDIILKRIDDFMNV